MNTFMDTWLKAKPMQMALAAWWTYRTHGMAGVMRKTAFKMERWLQGRHPDKAYQRWILDCEPYLWLSPPEQGPLISILTPVYNPDPKFLQETLDSVLAQHYSRWEWILADASTAPEVHLLLDRYAAQDSRIVVQRLPKNLGIAGNSQVALSKACGEFVAFLDHDDLLAPQALSEAVNLLNLHPDTDLVYSDEDKVTTSGQRCEPMFKPDWSPDLFLNANYLCHLVVARRTVVNEVGGFRPGYDGAQDYDLLLRLIERTERIYHIPKVLYHWRKSVGSTASSPEAKPYAISAGHAALEDAVSRRGLAARVEPGQLPATYRVRYTLPSPPRVSIIIPTRDQAEILERCLISLRQTAYPDYEVFLVDNRSQKASTKALFDKVSAMGLAKILRYDQPFNFQALNNFAARQVTGDMLLFLNNDTEVLGPDWLSSLTELAQRPEVGVVGAKLYYPDHRIQHAGMILNVGLVAGHAHRHFPRESDGYCGRLRMVQNVSAVTGACLMLRREVFEHVSGFDEGFEVALGDVDLCLAVADAGYRVLWTPYAELIHHESKSRGNDAHPANQARFEQEIKRFQAKWPEALQVDPYYHPNFDPRFEDFSLRSTPPILSV